MYLLSCPVSGMAGPALTDGGEHNPSTGAPSAPFIQLSDSVLVRLSLCFPNGVVLRVLSQTPVSQSGRENKGCLSVWRLEGQGRDCITSRHRAGPCSGRLAAWGAPSTLGDHSPPLPWTPGPVPVWALAWMKWAQTQGVAAVKGKISPCGQHTQYFFFTVV